MAVRSGKGGDDPLHSGRAAPFHKDEVTRSEDFTEIGHGFLVGGKIPVSGEPGGALVDAGGALADGDEQIDALLGDPLAEAEVLGLLMLAKLAHEAEHGDAASSDLGAT